MTREDRGATAPSVGESTPVRLVEQHSYRVKGRGAYQGVRGGGLVGTRRDPAQVLKS